MLSRPLRLLYSIAASGAPLEARAWTRIATRTLAVKPGDSGRPENDPSRTKAGSGTWDPWDRKDPATTAGEVVGDVFDAMRKSSSNRDTNWDIGADRSIGFDKYGRAVQTEPDENESIVTKVEKAGAEYADKAASAAKEGVEKAKDMAGSVADTAKQAARKAANVASGAGDAVKAGAKETKEFVSDVGGSAKQGTESLVEEAEDMLKSAAKRVASTVKHAAEAVIAAPGKVADALTGASSDTARDESSRKGSVYGKGIGYGTPRDDESVLEKVGDAVKAGAQKAADAVGSAAKTVRKQASKLSEEMQDTKEDAKTFLDETAKEAKGAARKAAAKADDYTKDTQRKAGKAVEEGIENTQEKLEKAKQFVNKQTPKGQKGSRA